MTIHRPHRPHRKAADTRGEQATRTCLRCDRQFASQHRGNRLCGACARHVELHESGVDARGELRI